MRVDYDGFLNEIRQFVANRDSGVIRLLRGVSEPVITIGFQEGEITAASCGSSRGRPALERIRTFDSGQMHVQRIEFRLLDEDLPETDKILSLLAGAGGSESRGRADNLGDRSVEEHPLKLKVLPILTQYIGPMADFVLEDELVAVGGILSSSEVRVFVTKLANNIKDPDKKRRFTEETLGALLGGHR